MRIASLRRSLLHPFASRALLAAALWGAAPAPARAEATLEAGPPVGSLALMWQDALDAQRAVIPPGACLDLFERLDGEFDDLVISPDYREAFDLLQRSDMPALLRLMERLGCHGDLRLTPRESLVCRTVRLDARTELGRFETSPIPRQFFASRAATAYLALVAQARALGCFIDR